MSSNDWILMQSVTTPLNVLIVLPLPASILVKFARTLHKAPIFNVNFALFDALLD